MLKSLRKWMFYRSFNLADQAKKPANIQVNPMRSVCILFDGSEEEQRKRVHQFKKMMSQEGRSEVKSLAFVNNRLPLDNVDYAAYNLKDINWYGIPSGERVQTFIKYDFDLMIVLCKKMLPHYEYIIAHSGAHFKVGPDITRAEKYFDLIVDLPKSMDTGLLINNIIQAVNLVAVKNKT